MGNATCDVPGDDPRASGLGVRSGRCCAFGMFREAMEGARTRGAMAAGPTLTTLCCSSAAGGGGTVFAERDLRGPPGLCGVAGRFAMMFWYLPCIKEAVVGDWGGFALAARVGGGRQTWSPSSAMGTGWLQFEHLTVGSIWEIRPGSGPAGESSEAIKRVGE